MKKAYGAIVFAGALLIVAGCSPLSGVSASAQKTCPVMGGEIDKQVYTDYTPDSGAAKRVYFCCEGCVATFNANPEKYVEKLENEGVTLEDAPQSASEASASEKGDCSACTG